MKRKMKAGQTSVSLPIFIQDSSSTTGAGLAVAFNAAGLVGEYRRRTQSTWTAITLSSGTLGTWTSGGWVADGALTGAYEVDIPDAAVASGDRWVAIRFRGVTNMLPVLIEIELDAVDYQDTVRFGMTALPNVASGSAGAIITSGTGTAQLNVASGKAPATLAASDVTGNVPTDVQTIKTQTIVCAATTTILASVGTAATSTAQTGDSFARIGAAGAGLTSVALAGTQAFSNTGTWTGNIVGTLSTLTTYTGNTPQTGDSFARIGAAGAGLTALGDTRIANLDAAVSSRSTYAGGAVASVTAGVTLSLTQAVPTSNTAGTVGDALNAARAQGFGKWSLSGTTLTLYASDGTTAVRTFSLDSATAPTSRT
mgnify:CR=1 FL=1